MKNRVLALFVILILGIGCNTDPNVAKKRYVENGNKYYDKGKYKEALIMYRNALKKDLKYGEAYYRLALTEIKLGRYAEAARDLHRTIEFQSDNLDAYSRLINIYLNAYLADKRRPAAYVSELRGLADKLQKIDPNSFEYLRANGYINLLEKKNKDAILFFEKANAVKPLQPDLILVYVQALEADGRAADSEKLAYEMLKKDPKVLTIYDALFLQYLRQNRIEDAERIMKSKVDNNPKIIESHLQLAAHYFSVKKRDEMLATLKRVSENTKDFPDSRLKVGDFFLRIRDLDLALKEYEEGAKAFPDQKNTYRKRIVEALVLKNKKDEGSAVLTEILKDDPKDPEAIAMRASMSMMGGTREQLQQAINDLQTVVSRLPDNPVLRFNLGRAHLARGNTQQAKIQFEEAVKLRADYLLPRIALAQIMQQQGEFGKVVQMAQEIMVYDPANIPARLLRTRALIGMGEQKQARSELNTLVQQFPNVWETKLQIAALDLAEQNYAAAENTFKAMYSSTDDPRALMGLTETYTTQKQYDKAMKLLGEELAKKPERVDYHVALGNIAVRAAQYPMAIDHFKKALEKLPKSADIWLRLGETQRRAGDLGSATASFNKAKDLAPTNVMPYLQLALLADLAGQKDQAKPLYEQIIKLQPDNAFALNNLAYMLAETGQDLDQALTMAQRAKQKLPQDPNVADTLGWIYIKKNLSDAAINIFRELVRQDPDRSTYRYHLAMALAQKGDKPAARKELEAALRGKPAKDEEQKIRELLSKVS